MDVLSSEEPRNGHAISVELVHDGDDIYFAPGRLRQPPRPLSEEGFHRAPRDDPYPRVRKFGDTVQALLELPPELIEGSHTVLGQGSLVIIRIFRKVSLADQVQLISRVTPPDPTFPHRCYAELVYLLDGVPCLIGRKESDGTLEIVLRESHGHDGERKHALTEAEEIVHGPIQMRSVVPLWTKHDLCVDGQAVLGQVTKLIHDQARTVVDQQSSSDFGFRGMDAHVERTDPLLHQALHPPRPQVRQCHVAPVREGEAKVVVAQPQAFPDVFWISIDEAKNAFVAALPNRVGSRDDPHGFSRFPFDVVEGRLALGAHRLQLECRVGKKESEIDSVANPLAVDSDDARTDLQMEFVGDTAAFDFSNSNQGIHRGSRRRTEDIEISPLRLNFCRSG